MPKTESVPQGLRAYAALGMDLRETSGQATSDCPFCLADGKWFCSVETGLWDCKRCGARGNPLQFVRQLHEAAASEPKSSGLESMARDRGLLRTETLDSWGMVVNPIDGRWILPGFDADGRVHQLYRLTEFTEKGIKRRKLLPLPGLHPDGASHGFHCAVEGWDATKPGLDVFEGPWDGMAAWEAMGLAKDSGGRLSLTSVESQSLRASTNVVAVPGVGTFPKAWLRLAAGKRVTLWYDSDHPRTAPGGVVVRAGWDGMRRLAAILCQADEPPESVSILRWGDEGHDPSLADGFDVRDWLKAGKNPAGRIRLLQDLRERIQPIPEDWAPGRTAQARRDGKASMEMLSCRSWAELQNTWRKAMKWFDGLDKGLSVMLACILSTESAGDQLWIKLIAPPSSGKSVLCEAVSVNKRFVLPKSTLRGFHSGYDDGSGENHSPLLSMKNKTLVIKDGDTLLQAPNLGQILSEARDIYDRVSRSSYRSKQSMDHEGLNITIILAGTSSLYQLDQSELGARFLDCVVVDKVGEDMEREISMRVAYQAAREMVHQVNGKAESADGPEMLEAKRMTGGYIDFLRENATVLLEEVASNVSDAALEGIVDLASFVAFMRAAPSVRQSKTAEKELPFRLTKQLTRLSMCLAVVLNRKEVDGEVMRRVRAVALDTSRGRNLAIAHQLWKNPDGLSSPTLAEFSAEKVEDVRHLLRYLSKIGAVKITQKTVGRIRQQGAWQMTDRLRNLYRRVFFPDAKGEDDGRGDGNGGRGSA